MRHGVILFLLCLFVLGCGGSSGGSSQAEPSAGGRVSGVTTFRVQLPTQTPQQIRAQEVRIDRVTVAVSSGGSVVRTAETAVVVGQTVVDISVAALPPGNYTIKVDGFQGATLLATDTANATLTPDESVTVTLTLTFVIPLSIDPPAFNLIPGAVQQVTASRGTTAVTAVWASDAPGVATVDQNGLVTAVAIGIANITATENGDTVTSVATVSNAVVLNTITVTPDPETLAPGQTRQYTATGNFSDMTTQDLTNAVAWTSSDTDAASINGATGFATAVGDGVTTIRATQGTVFGEATLNVVTVNVLTAIVVTPANVTIAPAATQAYTATGIFSAGPNQDITNSVVWTSSVTGFAAIDVNLGVATGVADGVTEIRATQGTIFGNTNLTVAGTPVLVSLEITPMDPDNDEGEFRQFTATGTFSDMSTQNLTTDVTWSVDDTFVADIDALGEGEALNAGVTDVTATLGAISDTTSWTINGTGPPVLVDIQITPQDDIIFNGDNLAFTAIGEFSDGSFVDITSTATWASNTTGVATIVANSGLATAVAPGVVTSISASQDGETGSTTLSVYDDSVAPNGMVFNTDTDPAYTGDDILPDVALVDRDIMVVKGHRIAVSDGHVLLERFTAAADFQTVASAGAMVDFGIPGSFVTNGTPPVMRMDFAPSVTMNQAAANDVAVVYESNNGIVGRVFSYAVNPPGAGTGLATLGSPRNPSVSRNTPGTFADTVVAHYAQNFRDFVADFTLGTPLTPVTTVTTSTSQANDVAVSDTTQRSVRTWIDTDTAPAVISYQVLNGNTPVGAIRQVQAGSLPLTGDFREVSASMFNDGRFVIVFDEFISVSDRRVRMATFSSAGTQVAPVATIANPFFTTSYETLNPDVEVIEGVSPSFYVTFKTYHPTAAPNGIVSLGRYKYPSGDDHPANDGEPWRVTGGGGAPGLDRDPPAIDVNANGDAVVVWSSKFGTAPGRVFIAPFPANANLSS